MRDPQFMGRITASAMHEMQNVLAIIKESAGLMDDFLRMQKGGNFKYHDKFLKMTGQIGEQVQRGMLLAEALNSFAHAPETKYSPCDLIRATEMIVFLGRRQARGRKITFMVEAGSDPIMISPNMLLVMELLDAVMNTAPACQAETILKIDVSRKGDEGVVRIKPAGECVIADPAGVPALSELALAVGGLVSAGSGQTAQVSFPLAR